MMAPSTRRSARIRATAEQDLPSESAAQMSAEEPVRSRRRKTPASRKGEEQKASKQSEKSDEAGSRSASPAPKRRRRKGAAKVSDSQETQLSSQLESQVGSDEPASQWQSQSQSKDKVPKPKPAAKKPKWPLYPDDHADKPYGIPQGVLRFVSWNVASLRSVVKNGHFQKYIADEKPHILCLQETKMTEAALEEMSDDAMTGYDAYWNHSERKGYSGVAVFIREDFSDTDVKVEKVETGMGDDTADSEGRVLAVHLSNNITLVNAYVPNSGGKLARLDYRTKTFEPKMRNYLNSIAEKRDIIYTGDLNVAHEEKDIHNSKGNQKSAGHTPEERAAFGDFLESGNGWIDVYRNRYEGYSGYTYYSRRFGTKMRNEGKGWRLDYFVMNKRAYGDVVADCFVRPEVEGSDHFPLILDCRLPEKS